MKLSIFTLRTVEQLGVAFVSGFTASLVAADGNLTRAVVVAGLTAGARAVYALVVRMVGPSDTPSAL